MRRKAERRAGPLERDSVHVIESGGRPPPREDG